MRGRFIQDQDCHWYFIPEDLVSTFYDMEEGGDEDGFAEFNNTFGGCLCDSPTNYVVTKED